MGNGRAEVAAPARAWIQPEALRALLQARAAAEDIEPCGVLLGRIDRNAVRIQEAPSTANVHPTPDQAFRIAPRDLLGVVRDARSRGLTVVGFWHGHIEDPAHPGGSDVEGMAAAEALGPHARVQVIVGAGAGRAPVVRAFVRGQHGPREIPLRT